jgi:rhodanese-related sulfurtransferase
MPQTITVHVDALVAAAEREIETLGAADAVALHGRPDVVFVDIRDIRELDREGRVPGAFHCPRGLLEFWVDPQSPYHKPVFAEDKRFIFFCAGRPALGARDADHAAHGLEAGRPRGRRFCRLEGGRWPGRGGAATQVGTRAPRWRNRS